MRIYKINKKIARLSAYLITVGYPFQFDGYNIEFTASNTFVLRIIESDKSLKDLFLNKSLIVK